MIKITVLLCPPPTPVLPPPEKHVLLAVVNDTVFLEHYARGSLQLRVALTHAQAGELGEAMVSLGASGDA